MVTKALWVMLHAQPGKEAEVEQFLRDAQTLAQAETTTTYWFALKLGPATYGIFDLFPDESARQTHLSGQIAATLLARAPDLFSQPLQIEKLDVLADKRPQ